MDYFAARYVLSPNELCRDAALVVEDGTVVGILGIDKVPEGAPVRDFGEAIIVPGLVNAHSHSFQRLLRGRTEYVERGHQADDFWSWRERMYQAALALDPEQMGHVARMAFMEMAMSGVTHVGEFHYVHHQPDGTPYDDPNELSVRVIEAAREVGLRIGLLRVAYRRAGFGVEANPRQRRFIEPEVDVYLRRVDDLKSRYAQDEGVDVGMAPHSVRAVPAHWLAEVARARGGQVVHVHAAEQRRELEECRAEHGATPIELIESVGLLTEETTIVHATHATEQDVERLGGAGAIVCACPSTERHLGDGFLPASALVRRGVPICVGSDSQSVIDLWEEVRLVEYHERLRRERRNVLAEAANAGSTAEVLWPMGTTHGSRSLGRCAGALSAGADADFAVLELDHPSLVGADAASLPTDVMLTMPPGAVRGVFVGGRAVVEGGEHPGRAEIQRQFGEVAKEVFGDV